MKKLVLTGLVMVAGAFLAHSQGLVTIQEGTKNSAELYSNSVAVAGSVSGASYIFELLDMTSAQYGSLTSGQLTGIDNLQQNPSDISLWTDSGISGTAGAGFTVGAINGLGAAAGTTAANWGAPTGTSYSTGPTDYYIVVGWSSNLGANWQAVSTALGTATSGWFGETSVYFNEAGGGANNLSVVNVLGTSAATTGLAGGGTPSGDAAGILLLDPVPEPTTLALAGLGGISMLFLRRRKA